jgi:Tfp pilus assembly protein PilF
MNQDLKIDETFNLAVKNHIKNNLKEAQNFYNQVLKINPNHINALNNLGGLFKQLGETKTAKSFYNKTVKINPNFADGHNNLGIIYRELGDHQKAVSCYKKAIEINPTHINSYNNLGIVLEELGEYKKALSYYEKGIEINPNNINFYWNAHILASDMDEALSRLKKLYKIDNKHTRAKIMISALEAYKGNFDLFNDMLTSSNSEHPYTRSAKWIFSLPKLPRIFFNRCDFFDAVIAVSEKSRPFYEFGVWNGVSFQYLINTFKKGFGFDTFTGIPETWHNEPKGNYSNFGAVPKIEGGEFIVGKFEDTLPDFFSEERPKASLINFDADLYSSTICALNYANKVIDNKTILVFDELVMNENWEKDEFKALNEFCYNSGFSFEVIAFSFSTKQVAVKLKKN